MKKIELLAAFIFSIAATTTAQAGQESKEATNAAAIYRYEVTFPEAKGPQVVRVKSGESQAVKVEGKVTEYTKEMSSLPAATWAAMVEAGTTPPHDFVKCDKKTCWYGTKERIADQASVIVRLDEKDGKLITTAAYDKMVVDRVKTFKLQGAPAYPMPETSVISAIQRGTLSVGDVLPVASDVQVRLVAVE